MRKVKLIVHETYQGKCKSEDVFAAVFLSKGKNEIQKKINNILNTARNKKTGENHSKKAKR